MRHRRNRRSNTRRTIAFTAALTLGAAAAADSAYHDAEVMDVEPIVEVIEYVEPKRRCRSRIARAGVDDPLVPIVGGLIGGAIGNAVGHNKTNKRVGAVIGAVIGGNIAMRAADGAASAHRARETVCDVVDETVRHEQVTAYMVTYRFRGEIYRARMPDRPGKTIRVRVTVQPT